MKPCEIADNIGKNVNVGRGRDLYMDECLRPVLNKTALLVKQCRSGKLLVSYEGRFYPLPMSAVSVIDASPQSNDLPSS